MEVKTHDIHFPHLHILATIQPDQLQKRWYQGIQRVRQILPQLLFPNGPLH